MYKNLNVVYDNIDNDIYYADNYLDILKEKDYVLKLENEKVDLEFKIVDNDTETEQKVDKSSEEKYLDMVNQVKVVSYSNAKFDFWKFKYLERMLCYDKYCIRCSIACLSYNYMIKQYTKQKLDDSNIVIILDISGNWNYYTVETKDMIFEKYAYYLFNNLKNANIYMIICGKDMKKYKSKVVNKKNNNTCYLLTQGTDGNILNRKTFDTVIKKMDDIEFDTVIITYINKKIYINLIIMYLYIIYHKKRVNITLFFWSVILNTYLYDICSLFIYMFGNIMVLQNKINGTLQGAVEFVCTHNNNNINKKVIDSIISNKNIELVYNKKLEKIEKFIDKLKNKSIIKQNILLSIINKKYTNPTLYKTITETIRIKQIYYAQKKKYKKYLLPK